MKIAKTLLTYLVVVASMNRGSSIDASSSSEYSVFSPADSTTCIPKAPSNGCDCGSSYAFLMSKNGGTPQCAQVWAAAGISTVAVETIDKEWLTFNVGSTDVSQFGISPSDSSWSVLAKQVQVFPRPIVLFSMKKGAKKKNKGKRLGSSTLSPTSSTVTTPSNSTNQTLAMMNSHLPLCWAWVDPNNNNTTISIPATSFEAFDSENVKLLISSVTYQQVQDNTQQIIRVLGLVSGFLTAAGTVFPPAAIAGVPIGMAFNVLSIAFPPPSVSKQVIDAMNSKFDELNKNLERLSSFILDSIMEVRKDVADTSLDLYMDSLQSIDYAFREMVRALNVSESERIYYAENYRAACNVPHHKPEDIIRNLYGYACGNITSKTENVTAGVYDCGLLRKGDRGSCTYGQKKRNDIFDIFLNDADFQVLKFQGFSRWMYSALLLAQFHHSTCLPLETAACIDKAIDPVFNQTSQELLDAIAEVSTNIGRVEYCFQKLFVNALTTDFINKNTNFIECSGREDEEKKNECLANQMHDFLNAPEQVQFNNFSWSVSVISFYNDPTKKNPQNQNPDAEKNFDQGVRCEVAYDDDDATGKRNENYGNKMVKDVFYGPGVQRRHFYFMYVRKNISFTPTRDLLAASNFDTDIFSNYYGPPRQAQYGNMCADIRLTYDGSNCKDAPIGRLWWCGSTHEEWPYYNIMANNAGYIIAKPTDTDPPGRMGVRLGSAFDVGGPFGRPPNPTCINYDDNAQVLLRSITGCYILHY